MTSQFQNSAFEIKIFVAAYSSVSDHLFRWYL